MRSRLSASHSHPPPSAPRGRRLFTRTTLLLAVATLASFVVRPDDWFETTADEQLRFDQCLMGDAVRLGGRQMYGLAQDALNQTPQKLRELATLDGSSQGPLSRINDKDQAGREADAKRRNAVMAGWEKPLAGLQTPGGFTDTEFHWAPGVHEGGDFYDRTGLGKWAAGPDWTKSFTRYDPTPEPDAASAKAVKELGAPLYGGDPVNDPSRPGEWDRQIYEHQAYQKLTDGGASADDARLFLASGGWARTAPEPGSAEFRITVEDLKTRFASCAWRDPLDPNKTLRAAEDVAAQEWQQEIAAQAVQRDQILTAGRDATAALATGTETMADLLGQSWIADRLTRWQDYWSPGGIGWIGDAPAVIQVEAAKGKCLDVANAGKSDGTPVQLTTCNKSVAQNWQIIGYHDGYSLWNPNAMKCLDVNGGAGANGTKIQIWTCNGRPGQQWKIDVRAAGELRNVGTDKCLDLHTFDNGQDAWLWGCNGTDPQKFRVVPTGHTGTVPPTTQFDQAKRGIAAAQMQAKKQLGVLRAQLETAKKAAGASDAATQAAYGIADKNGAPRGRGLLVGLQKAQVTKGVVAALEALVKAGETAEAATRAAGADSDTIAQRALAQAAQSKAEFRKEAARVAELQAKAAADAAKIHRDNAKKDKETAQAKLTVALNAEGDAKAAAADARAKRLAAEAEEKTAEAQRKTAAAKQAEAAQHQQNAQAEAARAKTAQGQAEAAEATASARRDDAVKARDTAKAKRDDAWDAEQKADAARAKADAKEAYAQSLDAGDAADAARTAADAADKYASDAEAAAGRARSEANSATQAAADADAAATRAEAAAKRARANADDAQAAKLRADAARATATSAAADAITAAQHAAAESKAAVALADQAKAHATTAGTEANGAQAEAAKALAASAKAAGFAYTTAQAAADAGEAAAQVARPANDAIQLGSPYVTTDSAAALVVLTGQASKSIAERQKAVADAHAKNATAASDAAKNLAAQAQGDAKQAYVHAANAAGFAAAARGYAKEALGHAADAATAASLASASLARTTAYGQQATADAAAANAAADRAETHATTARTSADQAALDATAARSAATEAAQAATEARAAADRAGVAAGEAEAAAKDAATYAKEAQEVARRTETKNRNDQIPTGVGGVGGVFYKTRAEPVGDPEILHKENCNVIAHVGDCVITANITAKIFVDLYLCTATDIPDVQSGCPVPETLFLDSLELKPQAREVTYAITPQEFNDAVIKGFVEALTEDFTGCWDRITTGGGGTLGNCGWAAFDVATLVFGSVAIKAIKDAVTALDAALRTGVAIDAAWKALRTAGVTEAAIEGISAKLLLTRCFPAGTKVATEDGPKSIEDIEVGDRVWSQDQATGKKSLQPVLNLFHHTVDSLVRITTSDGSVEATDSHRFWVHERGWTEAGELRAGDTLETRDGGSAQVLGTTAVKGAVGVYNFEVARNHTYYVYTGSTPVLVHNECLEGVVRELVKDGDHIVLGINPFSDMLAKETLGGTGGLSGPGARTFNSKLLGRPAPNGDGRPIWMVGVDKALDNPSVKLSISLDGVPDAKTAADALNKLVERGKPLVGGNWQAVAMPGSNSGTAWEVATLRLKVILGRRDFDAVDWYFTKPGDKVPSLVKDMPKPDWAQ